MHEYWRAEVDRDATQWLPRGEGWFTTREEAEQVAREKRYPVIARYRGTPDEMVRRPYLVRKV